MSASLSFQNISAAVDVAVAVDDVDASVALVAASHNTIFAPKDLHQKSKHTFQTLIPINCWVFIFCILSFCKFVWHCFVRSCSQAMLVHCGLDQVDDASFFWLLKRNKGKSVSSYGKKIIKCSINKITARNRL